MKVSLVLQKFVSWGKGEGEGGSLAGVDRFVVCKLVNSALKISWIVDFYKRLSSLANFKNVYKYYPPKRGISASDC